MARIFAIYAVALLILLSGAVSPVAAGTNAKELFNSSLNNTAQGTGHVSTEGAALWFQNKTFADMIGLIIRTALSFLGLLFLGLILYGGITWMLARGNEADVKKAQSIIEAAVIGLTIVVASYAITKFAGTLLAPAA